MHHFLDYDNSKRVGNVPYAFEFKCQHKNDSITQNQGFCSHLPYICICLRAVFDPHHAEYWKLPEVGVALLGKNSLVGKVLFWVIKSLRDMLTWC